MSVLSKMKNDKKLPVVQRSVFSLAWPIFFQSLLGVALGYVDTIML